MALGSIFLFLALLIIVALIVASPLIEGKSEQSLPTDRTSYWLAERERVMDALAELEADRQLGKVPDDVFPVQRRQLVAKGALALKEIEKVSKKRPKAEHRVIKGDDALEEMIEAYRAHRKIQK